VIIGVIKGDLFQPVLDSAGSQPAHRRDAPNLRRVGGGQGLPDAKVDLRS
jgi:hypothetical protein